ncbi:cutinase [Astrocystis sublimbata]|nr:cutinase [Astrocystis sublimbata]
MRFAAVFALASVALATPIASPAAEDSLVARQSSRTRSTENELINGGCKDFTFIFARGSTETGNMGTIVGPDVGDQLKKRLGANNVAIQGVNYDAAIQPNFLRGGTDAESEQAMKDLLSLANSKCPNSVILVGGYSQGAAVVHRAIEDQPQNIKNKIPAIILFGDTQKVVDGNQVPGYPVSQTIFFCANDTDEVCEGNLQAAIRAPHLSYGRNAVEAGDFLADRAN